MKECKHCSSTYEDNLSTCPNCGATTVVTEEEKEKVVLQEQYEKNIASQDNSKTLRKFLLIGIIALLAIIITIAIVVTLNNNRVYIGYSDNGEQIELTQKEIKGFIDIGDAYLTQGNYEAAINEYRKVPKEYDNYGKVQVQLVQAEGAFRDLLFEQADKYVTEGRFDDALSVVDAAIVQTGEDTVTALKRSEISDKYKDQYIATVDLQLTNGQFREALLTINTAIEMFGEDNSLATKRNDVLENYKGDYVARASSLLDNEQYAQAIELLNEATQMFGDDTALASKKDEILGQHKQDFLNRATAFLEDGKYAEALSVLSTANDIFGDDTDIATKLVEVNKAKVLEKLTEYDASQDYVSAISYINGELAGVNNDIEIREKLNYYIYIHKDEVLNGASQALQTKSFTDALSIVNDGLTVLPDDPDLLAAIDVYSEYRPISVLDLPLLQTGKSASRTLVTESATDIYGNVFSDALVLGSYNGSGWGIFKQEHNYREFSLAGMYSTVSGTIFPIDKTAASNTESLTLYIYADGNQVFSSTFERTSKPVSFTVDIRNCETLRVCYNAGYNIFCAIDNFVVSK